LSCTASRPTSGESVTVSTRSYREHFEGAERVRLVSSEDVDTRALSFAGQRVLDDGVVERAKLV